MAREIPMPHPGVVLREEFLEPMGLSIYALAKAIHVTRSRINEICHGRQGVTANIALRLGRFFEVDPQWFMNMQAKYDLHVQAKLLAIWPRSRRGRRREAERSFRSWTAVANRGGGVREAARPMRRFPAAR